ncbi:MAG: hypothetical protein HC934_10825 [Acaryochloridaceae cyanobacterium SU_2_1]|nr:hypothetical protein [Acaryochloridaceae cyanobacterium SU_2_1]
MDVLIMLQETIEIYLEHREGKLLLFCAKQSTSDNKKEFKIGICGSLVKAFKITEDSLDQYLLQRKSIDNETKTAPYVYVERCLLKILRGSGWGEISIDFHQGRQGKVVAVGRMTLSDRILISPVTKP